MTLVRPPSGGRDMEQLADAMVPWVYEAGCPYFDWFFGGQVKAMRTIRDWVRRDSSELFAGRSTVLLEGSRPIGGFIALGGAELEACRKHDAIAAITQAGRHGLSELRDRLREGQGLFAPVGHDDFYLSKVGVLPAFRGRGYGTRLVERYLADGLEAGFRRFRLDVSTGNESAIRLYRSFGLELVATSSSAVAGMTYASMLLER